ncbi:MULTISPECIES: glutaredoxin family protein [Salimicrobium]|uniref:Glutaredoxin-like domain n=2 Tax=Salimicrobium TaxID=351195 RepID=A0ABY1KW70_9BACI|nr:MULTISPECIES: glutaredoxin family protein [Salimicrobium]SDX99064.1 Glutaredoxin-like domain [Salimicrobium album]SIS71086.1 Glutaredoxin-like domain [Salimicrobium salexigens]
MNEITLFSRNNCPLCEEVKVWIDLLAYDYSFEFREKDIEEDDDLHEKYALQIPVVHVNGEELIFPQLSENAVRERLQKY